MLAGFGTRSRALYLDIATAMPVDVADTAARRYAELFSYLTEGGAQLLRDFTYKRRFHSHPLACMQLMKRRDSAAAEAIVGSPAGVDRAACCSHARRSRTKSCSVAPSRLQSRFADASTRRRRHRQCDDKYPRRRATHVGDTSCRRALLMSGIRSAFVTGLGGVLAQLRVLAFSGGQRYGLRRPGRL